MGNPFRPIRKRLSKRINIFNERGSFADGEAFYGLKFLARRDFGFFSVHFYTSLKHSDKQLLMAECSGSRLKPLDTPIEEYITEQENKNTRAKTQWDVKLLTAFLLEKNEQGKIEEIQPEELNRYVSEFILSVKRKDGQDYDPSSLRELFSSFNR